MEQNWVPNGFILCKGSFSEKKLAKSARIITSYNPSQVGMIFRNADRLCHKLLQSEPEKTGQVGQTFLQQLPLKLSGSVRENYYQLGNNFLRQQLPDKLSGSWEMTVLKMRPKLGHIFANTTQIITKRSVCRPVTMMVTSFGDEESSKLFP